MIGNDILCLPIMYEHQDRPQALPHIFTLTSHQATMSNVIACRSISLFHPMTALPSRYPRATSPSSPHHRFKSSSRSPSSFLTKFYLKMPKIQASRLAFSPDQSTFSFSSLNTHNNRFSSLQSSSYQTQQPCSHP